MRRWWDEGGTRRVFQVLAVVATLAVAAACISAMTAAPSQAPGPSAQAGTPPTTAAQPPVSVPAASATAPLGVYGGPGGTDTARSFARSAGVQVPYALDYFDDATWQTMTDPVWVLTQWSHTGDKMIWGVPMLPVSGATLAEGATGAVRPEVREPGPAPGHQRAGLGHLGARVRPGPALEPVVGLEQRPMPPRTWPTGSTSSRPCARCPGPGSPSPGTWPGTGPSHRPPSTRGTSTSTRWRPAPSTPGPSPADAGSRWSAVAWAPTGPQWFASFAASHHKPLVDLQPHHGAASVPGGGGDDPAFVSAFLRGRRRTTWPPSWSGTTARAPWPGATTPTR